tara:strand:- start:2065 stop:2253 length:189 start_codon:yes stop_codon:yes gene_type:complete
MDTSLFKSIALNIDTYTKLRELSDKQFEMPQSMAKTAAYYIQQAHKEFSEKNKNEKSARAKA